MNAKGNFRLVLIIAAALAVTCVVVFSIVELTAPLPRPVNGLRLANALAQYARDLHARGTPVPKSVSLETLLSLGYLTPEEVKPFEGAKVTFYSDADDTRPQSVLIEARLPDGQVEAVLADGSVQQFSRRRWAEYRTNLDRQAAPGDGSKPVSLGTNWGPGASEQQQPR